MSTYRTPQPITAALTTAGARVRITATERTDTVVRVEPIDPANKSDVKVAEKTKVAFDGHALTIKSSKAGAKSGSVTITIDLPAGSGLVLNTAWTEVQADGEFGDCELELTSGQVQLDRIGALRGNLASGGVAIGRVAGPVHLEGGSADLRIGEVDGTVWYRGSTGKIWLGEARSDVELEGSGGAFDIGRAAGDVVAKGANCPIRIGSLTHGQAELVNAAGGIEVGVGEGSTASVDAKSTKGAVRNSLPTPEPGAQQVKVYARTRLDDIVIHRAAA